MKVKDLKQLLADAPDELDVMICKDSEFDFADAKSSGLITFGGPCTEDGTPIEGEDQEDITVFAIFKHGEVEVQ